MKKNKTKWVVAGLFFFLFAVTMTWAFMPGEKENNSIVLLKARDKKIEKKADKILREMSNCLSGLDKFSIITQGYYEVVLDSINQKIQLTNMGKVSVQRPDKLKAERKGEIADVELYYNKDSFTVYGKKLNMYATTSTPDNLDSTIDYLRENFDLYLPGTDLLYSDVYSAITEDVISGIYLGQSMAGNVLCDHLAFKGNEVDWQLWIEVGPHKLPRKYVITSKNVETSPEFSVEIMEWNINPKFKAGMFSFNPPAGSRKMNFNQIGKEEVINTEKK